MEQAGVDDDKGQVFGNQRARTAGQFRMDDAVELGRTLSVAEGLFSQDAAIDVALAGKDVVAKSHREVTLHAR